MNDIRYKAFFPFIVNLYICTFETDKNSKYIINIKKMNAAKYRRLMTDVAIAILTSVLCLTSTTLKAESKYTDLINYDEQHRIMSYLCDPLTRGRELGSRGGRLAGSFIMEEFKGYGLETVNGCYTQSFQCKDRVGRNIIGMVPAQTESDRYIVVSAHYDQIGTINGYIYAGADDNASGVVAMMNLAKIYAQRLKDGKGLNVNLLFIAFDGKEASMAGSRNFVEHSPVPLKNIDCVMNIDQFGSVLVPPGKDTSYVLVLGADRYKKTSIKSALSFCNLYYNVGLQIDHTFYGSKAFYETYLNISDQKAFADKGIPAMMFTSGFHEHNYKETDTEAIISFPTLKKRTELLYRLINYITE